MSKHWHISLPVNLPSGLDDWGDIFTWFGLKQNYGTCHRYLSVLEVCNHKLLQFNKPQHHCVLPIRNETLPSNFELGDCDLNNIDKRRSRIQFSRTQQGCHSLTAIVNWLMTMLLGRCHGNESVAAVEACFVVYKQQQLSRGAATGQSG